VLSSLLSHLASSHDSHESSAALISAILSSVHSHESSEEDLETRIQRVALNHKKIKELQRKISALEQEFNCAHPCNDPPEHARVALGYLKQRLLDLENGVPEAVQAKLAKQFIAHSFIEHHNRKLARQQDSLQQAADCEEATACERLQATPNPEDREISRNVFARAPCEQEPCSN